MFCWSPVSLKPVFLKQVIAKTFVSNSCPLFICILLFSNFAKTILKLPAIYLAAKACIINAFLAIAMHI